MKSLTDPLTGETVVLEKRDLLAKADKDKASTGRRVAAGFFAPIHGAVAGRKGRKLHATGAETAGAIGGSVAGSTLGTGAALLATKGKLHTNPVLAGAMARTGASAGSMGGVQGAVSYNQKRGNYKREVGKAFTLPPQSASFSQGRTAEGPNVSHANKLSRTKITPRRNPTGKLVLIKHGGRSVSGSSVGKMFSETPARSGRRLVGV